MTSSSPKLHRLPVLVATALLAACASTGGLQPAAEPRPIDDHVLTRSLSGAPLSPAEFPTRDWWRSLGDPQLDALIAEALQGSPSLAAADARVRKAQAQAGLADAERKPTVSASGQYVVAQLPSGLAGDEIGGQLMHNAVLMLNFKWPLDVWGGKRAEYLAALGQAHASEIEAQAARLALSANIARTYVALAQAFDGLDVADREQARSERLMALSRQRAKAGIDSQLSVRNAEVSIATAKAQAEAAQQQIDSLRNAIAALLGESPDRGLAIARPQLLQAPAPGLPSVLPSELLGHRPDVVAARWKVEAAAQGIKSAKAKFKPSIDLSALVGLAATGFSGLFDNDALLGFGGPAISLPIFDGGRLRQNLASHDADYDLAVAGYDQTVVDGLHEVVDAVQAIRALDAQSASLEQARAAAASAYDLAGQRYHAGLANQLDVLAVQKPLLQVEQQLVAVRAQRYAAAIDLDQALGGGLQPASPGDSIGSTSSPSSTPATTP
jgi:NodT family efflux transporter outer membrane factor (OMF) lipoprotein